MQQLKNLLVISLFLILTACAGRYTHSEVPVVSGYDAAVARGLGERAQFQGEFIQRSEQANVDMIIYFPFDSSQVELNFADNDEILSDIVKQLINQPALMVRLEGHSDQIGEDNYNLALSEKRAQHVRQYLIDHGVMVEQIEITSYGSYEPIAYCDPGLLPREYRANDSCPAVNRRVEIYWQ